MLVSSTLKRSLVYGVGNFYCDMTVSKRIGSRLTVVVVAASYLKEPKGFESVQPLIQTEMSPIKFVVHVD